MGTYQTHSIKTAFVVKTSQSIQRHHGLRTNTSPHLLTFTPGPGDEIVAAARLDTHLTWEKFTREDGTQDDRIVSRSAKLDLAVEVNPIYDKTTDRWSDDRKILSLASHPGRACSLGEDTYEADTGDTIEDLIREHLEADFGTWRYAPVSIEFLDYFTPADGAVLKVEFERPFSGEWTVKRRTVARSGEYVREDAK